MKKNDRDKNDTVTNNKQNNNRVQDTPAQKRGQTVQKSIPFAASYPSPAQEPAFNERYQRSLAETTRRLMRRGLFASAAEHLASDIVNSELQDISFDDPNFEEWTRFRTKCRFASWLRDPWRQRTVPLPSWYEQKATNYPAEQVLQALKDRLEELMVRMSPIERELLHLRFWEEHTLEEIVASRLLPLSESALRRLSARLMRKLRREMDFFRPKRASSKTPSVSRRQDRVSPQSVSR